MKKDVKNNAMHKARFHEGNDGHMHQLYGLRISYVMNGPKNSYITRLLNSSKIGTWVHGPVHLTTYRGVRSSSTKEVIQGKSGTHEIARNQGRFQNKRKRIIESNIFPFPA